MNKEIGSNYWLSPKELEGSSVNITPSKFNCFGTDYVWTSTGRSAISLVLSSIENAVEVPKRAVLPAFTCDTVVEPFVKNGYEIFTYNVDKGLVVNEEYLSLLIKDIEPSVLLFHNYFGFETFSLSHGLLNILKGMGTILIEDCTQTLFSSFRNTQADFWIASIRKWSGVPDGGFAVRDEGVFTIKPRCNDEALESKKIEASLLKYDYIINGKGNKSDFLEAFAEAENILNNQTEIYSISPSSMKIQGDLNVSKLKVKRRDNYSQLYDGIIKKESIKPAMSQLKENENVVPLYFPLYCNDRRITQKLLASNDIYAPILWPCPKVFSSKIKDKTVKYIYEHLLCIPIDQRYDSGDMDRILKVLYDE
jgi:hypothetical protein